MIIGNPHGPACYTLGHSRPQEQAEFGGAAHASQPVALWEGALLCARAELNKLKAGELLPVVMPLPPTELLMAVDACAPAVDAYAKKRGYSQQWEQWHAAYSYGSR